MASKQFIVDILARDHASRSFKTAGTSAQKLGGHFKGLGSAIGIGLSIGAIVEFGKKSVEAFGHSQVATQQLQTAMSHNPKLLGESTESFIKLAEAISHKTAADRLSVESGIAALANFKVSGKQIRDAIPIVVDYARRLGLDVPTAATLLGKATLGNARALKALGIKFTATGDSTKDFNAVIDLARGKVGGFAEKEAKTATGRIQIMKNRFEELQITVGQKTVQAFDFVSKHAKLMTPIIVGVGVALKAAAMNFLGPWGLVVGAVVGITLLIIENWGKIKRFLVDTWNAIKKTALDVWNAILHGIGVALAAIVMGVRLMVTAILGYWGLMIHAAATAFGWIPGIGGKLKAADRAFHDWSRSVIGKIKDVENTLRGLGSQTGPGKWSLSIAMKGKGHVAQHGFHGWVHGPTTFLAGEAGSERVDITPIRQRRGGGGGGINVYIDARGAIGLNAEQLVNLVHTGLLQKKRRVPSLGLA